MVEDTGDGQLVGDVGDDLEGTSAGPANERIGLIHLADQPYPARRTASLGGGGLARPEGSVSLLSALTLLA
jgi:hypothetical protein